MNQKEFLKELEDNLLGLPDEDVKEILEDYKEHFKVGKKKKRKESEIAKSLGNPREIARDARRELKKGSELSLSEEFIDFKIRTRKLSKKIWKNLRREIPRGIKNIGKFLKGLKKKKKGKEKFSKNKKNNSLKITLLILLNFLVVLWLWIGLFATIIGLIVSGWAIVASGIISFLGILFGLAMPFSAPINNLLFSGLFASFGITCFGLIFSILTWKLGRGFFWLTKKYLRWNNKIFGGKNE